ncbi:hypothetical protein, partial [Klebsiella pneumoniae]|uniref:hypothetical protein n=1 Tax=Klebsiella pneumoniae TaxID=573 RepID=UPI001CDA369B
PGQQDIRKICDTVYLYSTKIRTLRRWQGNDPAVDCPPAPRSRMAAQPVLRRCPPSGYDYAP